MNDVISGILAGFNQTLIGYPLDTIKVIKQNKQKITKDEKNIKRFYKGCKYPFFFSIIMNAIYFPIVKESNKHVHNNFIAGGIGGVAITPFRFYFDVFTVRSQLNKQVHYSDVLTTKGFGSLLIRELFGLGIYYGSFMYSREEYKLNPFISGGIAGFLNWTLTYPIDTIKNRQMGENKTIMESIKMGNIWRGYSYCALRSVLVNSVVFSTYEYSNYYLSSI